jgi:hypothetical protein
MGFKYEISRWSYKTDTAGNYTDEATKKDDHALDAMRYVLHTLFGKSRGNVDYTQDQEKKDLSYEEAVIETNKGKLDPHYLASLLGEKVLDNRHILEEEKEIKFKKKSTTGFDPSIM